MGLVVLAVLGTCEVADQWRNDQERSRADEAIATYLSAVRNQDLPSAHDRLCEERRDGYAEADFARAWAFQPLASFVIVKAWDWSSWVDGHGRSYRV
jgi:hypothetical protein